MGGAMKAMKLGMIWVLVGTGLAMLLSVWVLGSAQSVSALDTDPVLVGAGDIASCTSGNDEKTAALLAGINGTVAALGDNAYDYGTSQEFAHCYDNYKLPSEGGGVFDPARNSYWGQYKALTQPAVGNHEYDTPGSTASSGASGYFGYFGNTASPTETGCTVNCRGYYSYDLRSWHVVVLNSNCAEVVGGCGAGSPQEVWLRNDLANTPNKQCTLAYWHHPRFSSSGIGNNSAVAPFWDDLYQAGAEVVLNGHAHNYERFAPQDPDGNADPDYGIREFIVGTGGKSLNSFGTIRLTSEVRLTDNSVPPGNFGVIKLTLHPEDPASGDPGSYAWEFRTIDGKVPDSGSATPCHGAPPTSTTDRPGPPSITKTDPGKDASGVATTTKVTAFFSEEMDRTTINGKTFKLFKKGTSTKIGAGVTYFPDDQTTDTVEARTTLVPTNSLQSGVTYKAVVTTGAKDTVGNPLPQQYKWFFTVG
jgi:hypothetical protein